MTDKQRTCGDCAWYSKPYRCKASRPISAYEEVYVGTDALDCPSFRSPADQTLIDECHRLRSLGAAVEWHKIDRLVEIAAGKELERVKRCATCEGIGHSGVAVLNENGNSVRWVACPACQGTGYKKGGE